MSRVFTKFNNWFLQVFFRFGVVAGVLDGVLWRGQTHLTQPWISTLSTVPGAPIWAAQIRQRNHSAPTSARFAGWQQCQQNGQTNSLLKRGMIILRSGFGSITPKRVVWHPKHTWIVTPKLHLGEVNFLPYSLHFPSTLSCHVYYQHWNWLQQNPRYAGTCCNWRRAPICCCRFQNGMWGIWIMVQN